MKCKVCGNEFENILHNVKERIINQGEGFHYLECGRCGSWTMVDEVDISHYYPKEYKPYVKAGSKSWKRKLLDSFLIQYFMHYFAVKYIVSRGYEDFQKIYHWKCISLLFKRLCGSHLKTDSKILDVGCALGGWLDVMYSIGYKNLTGVDLFLPDDKLQSINWRYVKGEIFDIEDDGYDLITFNHSLEHMPDPVAALRKAKNILSPRGRIMVAIPLAGGEAHRLFLENYCQIDAPRHLFLYTVEGFSIASQRAGLEIESINYDSNGLVYSLSEALMNSREKFDDLLKIPVSKKYREMADKSNLSGKGDQGIFYLRAIDGFTK